MFTQAIREDFRKDNITVIGVYPGYVDTSMSSDVVNSYKISTDELVENIFNDINDGKLNKNAIEALFLEIFAISRNLERPENIAFLGPEGNFTHQAAEARFGAMSSYVAIGSIKGVFREVKSKKVKFGVVPIENSSNGIVTDTINCLSSYDSYFCHNL